MSFEASLYFCILLGFSFHIFTDIKMASGSAPTGGQGVGIRPLLPENEVPKEKGQDWLTLYKSKF